MIAEERVAKHCADGSLEQAILEALRASGKDIDHLHSSDLSGVDEFHLRWHSALVELAKDLEYSRGMHTLDIGSGLGGPSRCFFGKCGCSITGIDLAEEYVAVANALTLRRGLSAAINFQQGSAVALPFDEASFDGAFMIHVGVNIEDKASLFSKVRGVLKTGTRLGVYDITHIDDRPIAFPMPWAASIETSFVELTAAYRTLLGNAGFIIEKQSDRRALALRLGREIRDNALKCDGPPLGMQILMGAGATERLGNVMAALQQGIIAPIAIIARAV
jgi:ubiquinone/menaquinone biosynthesis C-methylase UbiE